MASGFLEDAERVDRQLNQLLAAGDQPAARGTLLRLFEALDFSLDSGSVPLRGEGLPATAERIAVRGGVNVVLVVLPERGRVLMRLVRAALKEIDESLAGETFLVAGSVETGEWQLIWPSTAGEKQIIRRITLQRGAPHRTVAEQLAKVYDDALRTDISQALERAYDVRAVTKAFFDEYARIFNIAEQSIQGIADTGQRRMFCQRLFNRLMFIYFLQRKGWLTFGGRTDYLDALWEDYQGGSDPDGLNFYDGRLRFLFFHGLNSDRGRDDTRDILRDRIGKVPFLNGGLFDEADTDRLRGVAVPDGIFPVLFRELFHRYNFTIAESTPYDVQVAVDPEMLGKVFEKLVTGRHETGSYYTPREIVSFMCREALKGYLQTHVRALTRETIDAYVEHHDVSAIDRTHAGQILEALDRVTVVDPACGSGAYLLGMMQELLDLQTILFNPGLLDTPRSLYDMKLGIIQRNLYGVDIDEFAVNVAMLRLWLALVVEFEGSGDPPALPNLDFKIVRGDSVGGPSPEATQLGLLTQDVRARLIERRGEYLRAVGEEKMSRRRDIERLTAELEEELSHGSQYKGGIDWLVEFPEVFEQGGFDVVVANPPYVRQESITEQKPRLRAVYGPLYSGTADLYVYFYYRALQVLRPGGMLAFISSNKWFKAAYGANLRRHVAATASIWSITDFGELPVFEAATFPMIFVAERGTVSGTRTVFTPVKSLNPPYPDASKLIADFGRVLPGSAIEGAEWRLMDAAGIRRLERMRVGTVPLREYVGNRIYYGIKTGLNEAFVIDGATREALITADPASAEIIKPWVTGQDVNPWSLHRRDRFVIFSRRGTDIDRYPAIRRHLETFRQRLQPKARGADRGAVGRKPGTYRWFEIQDVVAYHRSFEQPKIVFPDITARPRFAMDRQRLFVDCTAFIIEADDSFLLAVLGSQAVWTYLARVCAVLGDADKRGRLRLKRIYLRGLPVPLAGPADREALNRLAEWCLTAAAEGKPTATAQAEIDERVAKLYGLTGLETAE